MSQQDFPVINHEMSVGGLTISQLAHIVGQTPFYVYDRQLITRRIKQLRKLLPSEVHIHYAMKANPMPAVVCHLAQLVDGIDVASGEELVVALSAGAQPKHMSFAGPGKRDIELEQATASQVLINVESETELFRLAQISKALKIKPRIALRVNPDFELKMSGMKMGGGPKQFGIDAEAIPNILKQLPSLPLNFEGFHIFAGSQNLKPEAIIESQIKSFELALRLAKNTQTPLQHLNLGGGFGIPYFSNEQELDITSIAKNLADLNEKLKQQYPQAHLTIELGRYLVGEAGLYICQIVEKKISRGQTYLVVDGGMHHHLAASGHFGQVIRKNFPVTIANKVDTLETELVSVVGPLCTPMDLLADQMDLPKADVGDYVAILQSGAYGFSASPQLFLSHPRPREILI